MNNFALASLVFATGTVAWFSQHVVLQHSRVESQNLAAQSAAAQTSLDATTRAATDAQRDLANRRGETKSAQGELDAANAEAREAFPVPSMDPQGEGSWPAGKPYFYLAKKYISQIGYPDFDDNHHLSEAAAVLFGLSPAEKSAVENAWGSFYAQIDRLQATRAERLDAGPGVNNENHREVSFKISGLTNEVRDARTEMAAAVRDAVGETRSSPMLDHASADLDQSMSPMMASGHEMTVTYSADRKADGSVFHQIKLDVPGMGTMYMPTYFPLTSDSALWRYRHLFGEEPLIPLPSQPGADK